MGTRHLTIVRDTFDNQDEHLVSVFGLDQGSPAQYGADLAAFLNRIQMTSGLTRGAYFSPTGKTYASGAGCLAAQIVARWKSSPGTMYIVPEDGIDSDVLGWIYTVRADHASITVEVAYFDIETEEETPMFEGTPAELVEWCKSDHDDA